MELKCRLCGWTWESRVKSPAQCPRCKRYDWEGTMLRSRPLKPDVLKKKFEGDEDGKERID